ncbi:uncharacterized protein LOC131015587 isoform X2 [Salvia miltiorrhiza]|uniref:uncharacterized protein LOC131015587 isoform X2 n=1 Tax=Salvia miltiorrhiza TaxID=226208 RepID=UPI0025AC4F00|nr:uncharacterized protein LOC131015587 isoform X2 [Salvia miltiorrhiza]
MEHSRKLGSSWRQPNLPPPAPPPSALLDSHAQLSNADYRLYMQFLQESMSLTGGMTRDHMSSDMHGLDNLGHAELGASFLSLISGPTAHVPCDQQQLLDPNTVPVSNLLPPSRRTAHGCSGGSRVSVRPAVSWPHKLDLPSLTSGEIFPPFTLSAANANCSNNSEILQAAILDVQKSQIVACQSSHEKDKVNCFYPPTGSNTSTKKLEKYSHITPSQKIPVDNNASACCPRFNPSNSFFRVSCSGISGSLLLSDIGLLGVVCTCHGLCMSISKFSEHSGSCDVDPGNAVFMDNGETIAHWWKAFSSRTGIRVLEGHKGWDWPEGISVASGLTNHPISSLSNNPLQLNQVGSYRPSASYEQKNCGVINLKENHSCKNIVDEYLYLGTDRPSRECSNSVFKYFMNNSHENPPHAVGQHVHGLPNSISVHSEKASQPVAPTLDKTCESANSLLALPSLQDLKSSYSGFSDGTKNSLIFERPGVSSSIELRLGQPSQKSLTLNTKCQLAIGSNLNGVHEEASKVFFQANAWQGSGSTCQYADINSNPSERRRPTELEHSRGVRGGYGATTNCWKDSSNISLGTTNLNSRLLSFSINPETKCQFRNIYEHSNDRNIGENSCYESNASQRDKINLPWSLSAGTIKELGMDVSNAPRNINGDKVVECALDGLVDAAKSNIEVSRELKGNVRSFNLVLGENSTAFLGKTPDPHHMSTMTADKSYRRDFLNNYWKISSHSDITHFNRDHLRPIQNPIVSEEMPLGLTSKNSVSVPNEAPTLPKEKVTAIKTGLQYKSVEMPGPWNMLGLSDRDNGPPVRGVQEPEIIESPCVQSSVTIAPDPAQLLDSLGMPKFSEMGDKSRLPGYWMGYNCEKFCAKGRSLYTEGSVLPYMEQLYSREAECNFTHRRKEHSSPGLPYAYVPEKCSSAAIENYLAGQYDLNDDNFGNMVKGDRSGAATRSLHSKLNTNFSFLETAKSFDKAGSSMAPNMKSAESCYFQWRDVPKKGTGKCSLTRKEQEAVSHTPLGCPAADVAKSFAGFAPILSSVREHEISNISSGCSAPDVTQSSGEVNKKESSTTELRNINFAENLVLDKGSGNVRSCSSDDALDSELCPEFYGSASNINSIKSEPFRLVPRKESLSLIEEIRVQNSFQSKMPPYKIKRSYTFHEDSDYLQNFELAPKKKRKTIKWMKLDVSGHSSINNKSPKCAEEVGQNAHSSSDMMQMQHKCDQRSPSNCGDYVEQSGKQRNSAFSAAKWVSRGKDFMKVYRHEKQQQTNAHKSLVVDDTLRAAEMCRKRRLRLKDASARPTEVREIFCSSAELTEKSTSLGGCSNSVSKSSFEKRIVRPTVCGKYGIISNGNPSKPTKIVPLRVVLKTAASLADKSNRKADNYKKLKSTSVKEKKMRVRHVNETVLGKKVLKSRVNKCGTHSSHSTELESSDWSDELDTTSCSETSGSDYASYALRKAKNHCITDSKPEDKLKTKFKECRKRSLHELLFKGNNSDVSSSFLKSSSSLCQITSSCCGEVMENAVDGRAQTNATNKGVRCSEKHLPENSDLFCCVCGGSDKDEHNQLLQCNRFLLKGLRDEAEAVDNKNVSFYQRCLPHVTSHAIIPDSDSESLQPGEKVSCARTEGYKGRKREGFLHNHSRDTNRSGGCLVPQDQLNAWLHIHRQKPQRKGPPMLLTCNVELDCRKAYTRYKQSKSWKHLVVYKSGIHALGLYTSQFISRGAMVVEYVGEIIGQRVADRRESEYQSGKKLQHKSACYFFKIDKEHVIDATRKGGIARFVNHSCQPNCVARVISVRTGKKVVFFAERDIYPGEEITYDYHFNHEDEGEKIPCYCNSENCRRYLN